ncbi:MAG TPA: hypothetical protein VH573_21345 [Mycobacteriales bacterium]
MTAPGSGPLGQEARALVDAAREWAARTFPESHSAECQWCPVCRTVAALRDPDVADRVAGAVTAAAGTLASLLDAFTRPAPAPPPPPPAAAPAVHEIPVDEDP